MYCSLMKAVYFHVQGFSSGTSGKEPSCQCRRHKRPMFDPWVKKIPWRKAWQPTPVFLPGESHRHRSLVGHSPYGHKESDMTEANQHAHMHFLVQLIFDLRNLKLSPKELWCSKNLINSKTFIKCFFMWLLLYQILEVENYGRSSKKRSISI